MAKLDISGISRVITQEELVELAGQSKQEMDVDNITEIKMTSAQQDYIKHFDCYTIDTTEVEVVGDDIVGSIEMRATPKVFNMTVEVVE